MCRHRVRVQTFPRHLSWFSKKVNISLYTEGTSESEGTQTSHYDYLFSVPYRVCSGRTGSQGVLYGKVFFCFFLERNVFDDEEVKCVRSLKKCHQNFVVNLIEIIRLLATKLVRMNGVRFN